jgi:hypothetical protein
MSRRREIRSGRDLSASELSLVEVAVDAVVSRDQPALRTMGAYDDGADPFVWTRDYGSQGEVTLVRPPGEPSEWAVSGTQVAGSAAVLLDMEMCSVEEGRSDLTLGIEVDESAGTVLFRDLHVL